MSRAWVSREALRVLAFATAMSPDLVAVGKNAACFVFSAARDRNAPSGVYAGRPRFRWII
jgi:hypothetical protein